MKKIGVILSGCSIYDSSEIHEAVLALLAISRSGAQAVCFAPNKQQVDAISHLVGRTMAGTRSVLIGAVRVTRGEIRPLTQADTTELDMLTAPGGFDAAEGLGNFASPGNRRTVDRELEALAQAIHQVRKPLGFMCIVPAILPKIPDFPLRLIIGTDVSTTEVLKEVGAEHVPCPADNIVIDEDNKIVTAPVCILAQNIAEAASDVDKPVSRVLALAEWVEAT